MTALATGTKTTIDESPTNALHRCVIGGSDLVGGVNEPPAEDRIQEQGGERNLDRELQHYDVSVKEYWTS